MFFSSRNSLGGPIASTAPTTGGTTSPGEPRTAAPNAGAAPARTSGFCTKKGGLTSGAPAAGTAVPSKPSAGAGVLVANGAATPLEETKHPVY